MGQPAIYNTQFNVNLFSELLFKFPLELSTPSVKCFSPNLCHSGRSNTVLMVWAVMFIGKSNAKVYTHIQVESQFVTQVLLYLNIWLARSKNCLRYDEAEPTV